jgi:hypothetical protein
LKKSTKKLLFLTRNPPLFGQRRVRIARANQREKVFCLFLKKEILSCCLLALADAARGRSLQGDTVGF